MKLKKILGLLLAASCLAISMTACSGSEDSAAASGSEDSSGSTASATTDDNGITYSETGVDQLAQPQSGDTIATITVANYGKIKIRLFEESAPKAFENFVTHAKEGYYDGVIFHRVIDGFMIQTGDPEGTGLGGESIWGDSFKPEIDYSLRHYRGALAMAQDSSYNIGSQFYIVQSSSVTDSILSQYSSTMTDEVAANYEELGGTPWLDNEYTVFGQVYEGMDIVDEIAGVSVDSSDKPEKDIKITSIKISTVK